jgi:hypothetical protein
MNSVNGGLSDRRVTPDKQFVIEYHNMASRVMNNPLTAQTQAHEFMRSGVVEAGRAVTCIYVGNVTTALLDASLLNTSQRQALNTLSTRLCNDEEFGNLEVYANGAMNVFGRGKRASTPFGVWAVRFY